MSSLPAAPLAVTILLALGAVLTACEGSSAGFSPQRIILQNNRSDLYGTGLGEFGTAWPTVNTSMVGVILVDTRR